MYASLKISMTVHASSILLCRLWFSVACQRSRHSDGQDVIVEAVRSMIPDSVSIVSSRWVGSWFMRISVPALPPTGKLEGKHIFNDVCTVHMRLCLSVCLDVLV